MSSRNGYCPMCQKHAAFRVIDRSGDRPRNACPACNTTLELGSVASAPVFQKNVFQRVEEKRGHLRSYKRDPVGKY